MTALAERLRQAGRDNWIIDVPASWEVTHHPECLTLEFEDDGAFQFSSVRKKSGNVDHGDLQRVAASKGGVHWGSPEAVLYGSVFGICYAYTDPEGIRWRRWFLGHGTTLLFATLNSDRPVAAADERRIRAALCSLRFPEPGRRVSSIGRWIAALGHMWRR